jgi:hypothetical protein
MVINPSWLSRAPSLAVPFPAVATTGNVVNIDPETEKFDIRNRVENAGVDIDAKGSLAWRQFHFGVFVSLGQKSPLEFVDEAFLEKLARGIPADRTLYLMIAASIRLSNPMTIIEISPSEQAF